jgi:arylsulfatase A-like enzyme
MSTSDHPNILVLLCDQLRRRALSVYGAPDARTPHIDALAARGVRFNNACSTYPICVPFRFTMMTGEYAHSRKVPGIEYAMSPTERTLADEFNDAGYETIYIGKWHLDGGHGRLESARQVNRTPVAPVNQGRWQKWLGFELRNDPFDTYYFEDDDPTPQKIDGYQTDGLYDLGIDYLKTRATDRPFCTVISVEPPHNPFVAPEGVQNEWEQRDLTLPPNFQADDDKRDKVLLDRKRYYAMVENLDTNVGRIIDYLEQSGQLENTVVCFLSDHGELGGSHGLGQKQWPYEESVGIPFIVYDPRSPERAGAAIEDPVCTEDLFPTFLGLAGLKPQNSLHGRDLTDLMHRSQKSLNREGVLLEFVAELRRGAAFYEEVWRGFRTRRYKYTVKGNNMGGRPWQFYDLESDPYEMTNLVDDPSSESLVADHHRLLRDRIEATSDHFVLLPAFGVEGVNLWE